MDLRDSSGMGGQVAAREAKYYLCCWNICFSFTSFLAAFLLCLAFGTFSFRHEVGCIPQEMPDNGAGCPLPTQWKWLPPQQPMTGKSPPSLNCPYSALLSTANTGTGLSLTVEKGSKLHFCCGPFRGRFHLLPSTQPRFRVLLWESGMGDIWKHPY